MDRTAEHLEAFRYNRWANERMLEAAAALTAEAFRRDLGSSFSSVQRTLVHILASEWIWLRRWKGESPSDMPGEWETMDLGGIRSVWEGIEAERTAWLRGLGTFDLVRSIEYRNTRGQSFTRPVWQMLRHVVNHSSYHRGQVTTMLRQLGASAPSTDFIYFFDQPRH